MMTSNEHRENVKKSATVVQGALNGMKPKTAIILGSGLGGLADKVENAVTLHYKDLAGFPVLSVAGHAGAVVMGQLNGVEVILLQGRKHFYETNDAYPLKTMIRTMKEIGVETLFLSCAMGSLRAPIGVSELMLITDHINYLGLNPLTGPNDEEFGARFVAMNDAYAPALCQKVKDTARENNIQLHEGVYMAFRGPSFETPAEIRMAQGMGADAVGMSVVPDCIIARHCGLNVVAVGCVTNMGAGLSDEKLSHDHTIAMAAKGAETFEKLVMEVLPCL